MAGIDLGIVGQMEQSLLYAILKCLITTSWKVGATYAAAEKRVAREDPALHLSIKADTATGMPWCADDLEGALSHFDDFSVLQILIGQIALHCYWETEHHGLLLGSGHIVIHIGMRCHWDAITFFYRRIPDDMVNMAMRVDDHQRLETVAVDEAEKFILLEWVGAARVDDDAFAGFGIDDVGVFRKGIEDEGFESEHDFTISAQR